MDIVKKAFRKEYEFNAKLSCSQIFDCGTKKGFVNANIAFSLQDKVLKKIVRRRFND